MQLLTEKEVSKITNRALATLRNDRSKGKGIPYVKLGRNVRYDMKDLAEYVEQKKIKTEN